MKERNKKKQDLEDTPIPTYKQSRKTDRNLAGAAHSEKMFQTIFDHAALGVAQIVSKTGRFVRVNQRYCDIVGYSREEMETLTSQDITHTDDLQPDLDNMQHLLVGKIREFSMEKRYIRKDGSIVRVSLSAFALWDPGEEPDTHVAVVEDITKRRRMEEDLRKRETELNESRRVAHIGSWDWDTTTDSITWSPEYYRIYNINPKLPMPNYLDHLKIYTPESAERLDAAVRKAMQTGEPYELELELANQDTGRRWIRNRRRSLKNRSSRPKSSKASECLPAASPTISTTCFRVSLDISQWQN